LVAEGTPIESDAHFTFENANGDRVMRIFLTGATGLIGSAVARRLVGGGHTVMALVRSSGRADEILDDAVMPVVGDLEQPHRLAAEIAAADGVIHAGSPGYYSISAVDDAFISIVLMVLEGTGKPFVMTGGSWMYGNGELTEDGPFAPPALVCWRPALTERVRTAGGVRGIVISPGAVHGYGRGLHTIIADRWVDDGGPPALMTIGSGRQHWSGVHVDDLADLYVRAFESAPGGTTFIGAAGDNPTVHDVTRAMSDELGLGGRVVTEADEAAVARLGHLGEALLLDQQASGEHARTMLGWKPTGPSMLEDIHRETVVATRPRCGTRAPRRRRFLRKVRASTTPPGQVIRQGLWPIAP
jgi:nucleoside-diphosphate-sugar epimerase